MWGVLGALLVIGQLFVGQRKGMSLIAANHLAERFLEILDGREVDFYRDGMSADFERIAGVLLSVQRPGHWYDGVVNPQLRRRKRRQIEFFGDMWVGDDSRSQWTEPFRAVVTDKRVTKEGVWISIRIGEYAAEADLLAL
jgi:hypothetical protein